MKNGFATSNGLVYGPNKFFGEGMLLTDYRAPNGTTSLTFLEVFHLTRQDLFGLLESGRFPGTLVWLSFVFSSCFKKRLRAER